jgi:hypothetical protein
MLIANVVGELCRFRYAQYHRQVQNYALPRIELAIKKPKNPKCIDSHVGKHHHARNRERTLGSHKEASICSLIPHEGK